MGLHNLKPGAGARHVRKRLGRGLGSGHGKTSGRGHKGFNSRSGGGVRPGYEGGQMPLYMRVSKLRGPNKKMSMPFGPFRTSTTGVNVARLAGFEAGTEVTPEALVAAGIIKNTKLPVKILGHGELEVALIVKAQGFSKSAREKIEAAGGKAEVI
ncbi:MAG: 50S ribosomal protein L15 [Thermoleophilia bacterium]|nr:50S ribosomal protein L15 [Thermoleophilia bacterium]